MNTLLNWLSALPGIVYLLLVIFSLLLPWGVGRWRDRHGALPRRRNLPLWGVLLLAMLTFLISSAVIGFFVGHSIWDWIHSDNYHPGPLVKEDDMDASLFLAITLPLSFLVSAMVYRAVRWQRVGAVADPAALAPPTMGDQVKKTSTLAKESLTLSCFGVVAPPILGVFALAGIVCGHKAMRELRREPALRGQALAVWGLVVGYLAILVGGVEVYMLFSYR